ncbi:MULTISPECIES: glycerol dehydrogenase [Paenibacillus]|jgi:glycerol dehydrogenase|uniref:Glycerol dehydrogenase n=1 Tax=Paenibacillus odorifer TaxID=189426 RepID=A0A1R0XA21_9BACL|nr:glycerol dehydrogenase [Paenibacillus odorifer]AWV31352.1 glycerol dehydrogenase [Paenibacillus odorifer]MEC0131227.1 glycerol dehydrogenase [Paenibacillus odorifer]MEC0221788.1 glycerol dehydrogenase [Paenibacillus odorifer]OMC63372.1 glycerol dehydrogenase [Paenibacillus odorifer]OMC98111.1 glycerol dehydrogenase [Paenibacillus odorifer]
MSHFVRSVTSPKKFISGHNLLSDLNEYIKAFGDHAYVICDEFILERAKKEAGSSIEGAGNKATFEKFNYECTQEEINRNRELARKAGANIIVGIGGGKTLDTAKATAYYEKLPVVIFPTIASTDAPCTALAVIYNKDGSFDQYLFLPSNPDVVLADTAILASAPSRFFAAGIGDALATYFEARACYASNGDNLVLMKPSTTGLGISRLCYEALLKNAVKAKRAVDQKLYTRAVEETIEATIYLSGVGAESGGLAAAHAIHNGMTAVPSLHKAQHGEKVTFGLLAQLVLENASNEELETVIKLIKDVDLPLTLADLGCTEFIESEWRQVAEAACAEGDTMGNMPFPVTPEDVYNAIVVANSLAESYK